MYMLFQQELAFGWALVDVCCSGIILFLFFRMAKKQAKNKIAALKCDKNAAKGRKMRQKYYKYIWNILTIIAACGNIFVKTVTNNRRKIKT